jgi:hypothetical protein
MSGYRPEQQGKSDDAHYDKKGDPDRTANEELVHIWLPNAQSTEGSGLGLAEKHQDRVEFVLMRYQAQYCNRKGYKELIITNISISIISWA